MNSELEYAVQGKPRTAALEEVEKRRREGSMNRFPVRDRYEARLNEIEYEIFLDWRRLKQAERQLPAAPTRRPALEVGPGLGGILCGGVGELVGRDYVR